MRGSGVAQEAPPRRALGQARLDHVVDRSAAAVNADDFNSWSSLHHIKLLDVRIGRATNLDQEGEAAPAHDVTALQAARQDFITRRHFQNEVLRDFSMY